MASPTKFFCNESENLVCQIMCKFISIIQCGASTRDLLHSAVFIIRTVFDRILQFLCSKSHKKHIINKCEVIINYITTNHN